MCNLVEERIVLVETVIFENPFLAEQRKKGRLTWPTEQIIVPDGVLQGGVDSTTYNNYRRGLDSACADVVICTRLPDGTPAVLASKRASGKVFGGQWWMQGGAIHAYRSIIEFVQERAERECGVWAPVEALIGVYHTCAADGIASTLQVCFVATIAYEQIQSARADRDHAGWRFLTFDDLAQIPEEEQHWYPMRVFELALKTMPAH